SVWIHLPGLWVCRSTVPVEHPRASASESFCALSAGVIAAHDAGQNMRRLTVILLSALVLSCNRGPKLATFYPVPDFSLTDQTDKTVTLHELKGKVWVADFIFTNCG